MTVRITDPTISLERVCARIHDTERMLPVVERDWPALLPSYRRRLSALRATRTRLIRQIEATA